MNRPQSANSYLAVPNIYHGPKQPHVQQHAAKFVNVGPGAYAVPDSFRSPDLQTAPKYSIPKERRSTNTTSYTPGPVYKTGDAFGNQVLSKYHTSGQIKIGNGPRMGMKINDTPGAGSYKPNIFSIKKNDPKYSFGSKPNPSNSERTPAPGDYKSNYELLKKRAPGYSLSGRTPLKIFEETPGPGQYKDYRSMGKQCTSQYSTLPIASFSKAHRMDLYGKNATPGPGSYRNIPSAINSRRGCSFGLSDRDAYNYQYDRRY